MTLPASKSRLSDLHQCRLPEDLPRYRRVIDHRVRRCVDYDWTEDIITHMVLEELREHSQQPWMTRLGGYRVSWNFVKATGAIEHQWGDVAVLVRFRHRGAKPLVGAAFLEAKRTYLNSNGFDALSWEQLARQSGNASHHRVLLWDHESPYASTVLTRHVIAAGRDDRSIYELNCEHFAVTLLARYMTGSELDYSSDVVAAIKKGDQPLTRHLIEITLVAVEKGKDSDAAVKPDAPPSNQYAEIIERARRTRRASSQAASEGASAEATEAEPARQERQRGVLDADG